MAVRNSPNYLDILAFLYHQLNNLKASNNFKSYCNPLLKLYLRTEILKFASQLAWVLQYFLRVYFYNNCRSFSLQSPIRKFVLKTFQQRTQNSLAIDHSSKYMTPAVLINYFKIFSCGYFYSTSIFIASVKFFAFRK